MPRARVCNYFLLRAPRKHSVVSLPLNQVCASVCSGSEMFSVCCAASEAAFKEENIGVSFEVPFICEIVKKKRQICSAVHKFCFPSHAVACAFDDVTRVADKSAKCDADHGANVACRPVLYIDGLCGGFSCKDFSRENGSRKEKHGASIFVSRTHPGKSSNTIHGPLDCKQH